MFQIRFERAALQRTRVPRPTAVGVARAFALGVACVFAPAVACAFALALGLARMASADSTEVAGIASASSTEVAAVILSDDAMPQGPSVADRLAIIREKIQNALEYPPLARLQDSDGDALVRFEIDRSGSAQNIRLVRSSGHDQLDTSALRAVANANPLPWVYGPLEVPVHFELTAPR